MLKLPEEFVLYDTEYTAWEGSQARQWTGEGEHREIVQIGALKVSSDLRELDHFACFVKPSINPIFSEYFIELTGIKQNQVDESGLEFFEAITNFKKWSGALPLYAFGRDGEVIIENCELHRIECPLPTSHFYNIRDLFFQYGIATNDYFSSTIVRAFGVEPTRVGHDALNDARTVLDALRLLDAR